MHTPSLHNCDALDWKQNCIGILIQLFQSSCVSILFISPTCNIVDDVSGPGPSWTVDLGTWQNIIGVTISKPENGKFILTLYLQSPMSIEYVLSWVSFSIYFHKNFMINMIYIGMYRKWTVYIDRTERGTGGTQR